MNRREFTVSTVALLSAVDTVSLTSHAPVLGTSSPPSKVIDLYQPTPLAVQKIGGLLGDRITVNMEKRLLAGVNIDVLLEGFRNRPGQQQWIGEHCAKFIDAAMYTWLLMKDSRLKNKLDRAVRELIACQDTDGYLGTYLPADRWKDWDVWVHKYNIIALLNYYSHTNDAAALSCCKKMGDLLIRTFGPDKRSIVEGDWHVGMANSSVLGAMVNLYQFTGTPRYLDFARYIVEAWEGERGPKIVSTLITTGSVRKVANAKAYEMLSCIVGLAELYRATGDKAYLKPVEIAWNDIVKNRLYLTGTTSWDELFCDDGWLRADDKDAHAGVGEGCVTVTWMQLNLQLLRLTGDPKYADHLERSIFNALTAAQHPESGSICYFVPLNGHKRYGEVSHGPTGVSCCTSSIPRGIALIPSIAYGMLDDRIAINLYIDGEATFRASGVDVRLIAKTDFPAAGVIEFLIDLPRKHRFTIALRVPEWCCFFTASVGKRTYSGKPGTYLGIEREWRPSDVLSVQLDLTPRVVTGAPSYPDCVAIERGPQVMAVDQDLNQDTQIWATGLVEPVELNSSIIPLPKKWYGAKTYQVAGFVGNPLLGMRNTNLTLVSVADAGQSGQEYRVLLARPVR